MRLYDSLTQEKREFVPRDGDHVTMYFCGPTVYNYVHVGNARPYVVSLVARRYFQSLCYRVTLVENITDIDDRIIQKANAEGRTAREVAEEFAQAYREDTDRLGLGRPDLEPLATEHIEEIVELIEGLVERGHAYVSGADVYFDVDSYRSYGKLSKQQVAEMRHGARVDPGEEKADPLDFALWKGAKPGEPAWDSPWGPGRPGWHIECSAMSLKYLGAGFDIHGGGRDLIFPHHENEVAQAEAAAHPFARFWMHNGMLNLREEKMSKSVGNIHTLRQVLDEYRPEALIAAFVATHYRSPLEFSNDLMAESEQQVDRLRNVFRALADRAAGCDADAPAAAAESAGGEAAGVESAGADAAGPDGVSDAARPDGVSEAVGPDSGTEGDLGRLIKERRQAFDEALTDDLNTAAALAEVFGLAREVNAALAAGELSAAQAVEIQHEMAGMVYILGLDAVTKVEDSIPADVVAMAQERQECRAAKDFARADELRTVITERGYECRDAAGGYKIVPIR